MNKTDLTSAVARQIVLEMRFHKGELTVAEVEALRVNANATRSPDDIVVYKVARWNLDNAVGKCVFYKKSELEGKIITHTISKAYISGDYGNAEFPLVGFINLELINMAFLDKVEVVPQRLFRRLRKKSAFSKAVPFALLVEGAFFMALIVLAIQSASFWIGGCCHFQK